MNIPSFLIFTVLIGLCCSCSNRFTYMKVGEHAMHEEAFADYKDSQAYIALTYLNNRYYGYKPCDAGYMQTVVFTNDSVSVAMGESAYYKVEHITVDKGLTTYTLSNADERVQLLMKKVEEKYLFLFKKDAWNVYLLTAAFNDLVHYPLIIHNCKEKEQEKIFDQIDFEALWNTY